MDRRTFLSSSVLTATMAAVSMPASAADKVIPPEERMLSDMKNLENWAKVMRKQLEQAGSSATLDRRVLPSIAPWFGEILGNMAALKQV